MGAADVDLDLRRGLRRRLMLILGAIAAMVGVAWLASWAWGRHQEGQERAALVDEARTALAGIERCMARDRRPSGEAFLLRKVDSRAGSLDCRASDLHIDLERAAEGLGVTIDLPRPLLIDDADCEWIGRAHAALDQLLAAVDAPSAGPAPSCALEQLELVEPPAELRLRSGWVQRTTVRDGSIVIASVEPGARGRGRVGRTRDGQDWEVRELPPGADPDRLDWSGPVPWLVEVAASDRARVWVREGDAWRERARLPVYGIHQIRAAGDLLVVVAGGEGGRRLLLSSADRGATFSKPAVVPANTGRVAETTTVSPEGAVVLLTASEEGPARFIARRVEAGGVRPTTAELSWPAAEDDGRGLGACRDGSRHWALVRDRHLVVSSDDGRTWHEVRDLAAPFARSWLSCGGSRLALIGSRSWGGPLEWVLCDQQSCGEPVPVPIQRMSLHAVELEGARTRLWIKSDAVASAGPLLHVFDATRAALTPERVYQLPRQDQALPVLRVSGGLLRFHDGDVGAY
ncbi:MAG TPA: hypothetical protein VK698_26505 [Kofleriaceae bacterium]|nr:hypothetical protein [Kofleriaceae bacterium]